MKRFLFALSVVLLAVLAAAFMATSAFLMFYSFVSIAAFRSAMIFFILFGAGALTLGLSLALVYASKACKKRYDKKFGKAANSEKRDEGTTVYSKSSLKSFFSLSNVALTVLLVGALSTVLSAILGSVNKDKWVNETKNFMTSHGYYEEAHKFDARQSVSASTPTSSDLKTLKIDLSTKRAVVIFTTDRDKSGFVVLNGYVFFDGELNFSRSSDGTLTLTQGEEPKINDVTGKLIFAFKGLFVSRPSRNQVLIYVPAYLKDSLEIVGNYTVAKE